MNIISNNCFSANLYKDYLHTEYKNPFMWSIIDFDSICNLINNYDKLNFNNYELIKDKKMNFYIVIDNKVKIWWFHYRFNDKINEIKQIGVDVYSNKIWEYICEKYESRLKRMTDKPNFVIEFNNFLINYNLDTFKKFLEIPINYKTVIFHNYKDFKNTNKENCLLIYDENIEKPGKDAGAYVVPTYNKQVLEFLK